MDEGRIMDAFETHYHDDVVVVEADGTTRRGKNAQRQAIEEWLSEVDEIHGGETEFITSNENEGVTMVQSTTDVTIGGRRTTLQEVAVQEWKDGQIIRERFFYYVPADLQRGASREVPA
jgi:ketosteroid isomerase-like protein